jgi:hypothetical protein
MSTFRIEDIRSRIPPAKRYLFNVIIGDDIMIPPQYIERVVVPSINIDSASVSVESFKYNYSSSVSSSPLVIEFYEDHTYSISSILQYWRKLVRRDNGTYGYPSSYKKIIDINLLDSKGDIQKTIKCLGVYPTTLDAINLDGGSSERVSLVQQFSVDEVILLNGSGPQPGTTSIRASGPVTPTTIVGP